ncbi:23259_t:CDS:2 [Gigaspora margarita]|uniref:23259_t:CDS:1 n=1 Tax=Gigaspora margarita TaxID=4874 RepID=A0ABN7UEU9_GIGMA|nr:23259_t:CDS:2 [Gigaspora margarita]
MDPSIKLSAFDDETASIIRDILYSIYARYSEDICSANTDDSSRNYFRKHRNEKSKNNTRGVLEEYLMAIEENSPTEFQVSTSKSSLSDAPFCKFPDIDSVNYNLKSESYFHYLFTHRSADLLIEVGKKPNIVKFWAHTKILSISTPYFKCALSSSWARFENDIFIFKKPNITPQVGKVIWKKYSEKDIMDFLVASDELLIDRILDEGQCHLIEQKCTWILYNLKFITFISFRHKSFEKLQNYCIEKICKNPILIFRSNYFFKLNDVFWIKLSYFNFSKKELADLKSILQHFIPLIRFTEFSVYQFYTFVWPFRDIIDLELRKEIVNFQNNLKLRLNTILEPRQPNTRYLYANDSFIFSLGTCKNSWNAKFGFVKYYEPAIRDDPNLGPCFGKEDIYMKDKVCSSEPSKYEVFQVVYKRSEENRWISFMNPKYFENDKYVGPIF